MTRRRTVAGIVVAGAIALGACGGDEEKDDGLTRAQLDRQASAICRDGRQQFNRIEEPADITDPEQAATFLSSVLTAADGQLRKLRALEPAEDLKAGYERYTAEVTRSRDFVKGVLAKARAIDPSGLQDLQAETASGRRERALEAAARRAGLSGCAINEIDVVYDAPRNQPEQVAQTLLRVGGTDGVAEGFSETFKFPQDLTIHVQGGPGSPNYDPATKTINLYYGFVQQAAGILRRGQPDITEDKFGRQIAAVDAFILVHELGHAFIDVFDIPITGREEDAVDGMATVFFTDAVPNGLQYTLDAARFFKFLQDEQGTPRMGQFQDEHSLSIQRALDIVCAVAGATPESFEDIARLQILTPQRLQRCPAEYRQKSRAWMRLLEPHVRK